MKFDKFIFVTMEVYKSDGGKFNANRTTVGTIKPEYCPKFHVFKSIAGCSTKGSVINTYGSLYIMKGGVVYIDKAKDTNNEAESFSITFLYALAIYYRKLKVMAITGNFVSSVKAQFSIDALNFFTFNTTYVSGCPFASISCGYGIGMHSTNRQSEHEFTLIAWSVTSNIVEVKVLAI